jgi:hypothetical protein
MMHTPTLTAPSNADATRREIFKLEKEDFLREPNRERTARLVELYREIMPGTCQCRLLDCPVCDPEAALYVEGGRNDG